MSLVETVIRKEPWDVNARLAVMDLSFDKLLKVRSVALSAAADATPFHPVNAWGLLAYLHGTASLREEFVGKLWKPERLDGVEIISNEARKLRIAYANVDLACDEENEPAPRSRKGGGTERICMGNLFGHLPRFVPKQKAEWSTYYLMADEDGAAELSCPIVEDNTFKRYVERIILSDGNDLEGIKRSVDVDGDVADGFEPEVARKK